MKTPPLLILFLSVWVCFAHAQSEWNKEIELPAIEPGGTPVTGLMNLSGIGAVINKEDGKFLITRFFVDSGAEAAGLKISDVITHVDENDVSPLDLNEVVALIRGDPGTRVTLTVVRESGPPRKFIVTRHPVNRELK